MEHGGRTCCSNEDVLPIRTMMSHVRYNADPKVNDKCFAFTSKMLCSKCDADISTGITDGSICFSTCRAWFKSCYNEFIDPYVEKNEHVPFCHRDSMMCSKISDAFNTPE